AIGSLRTALRTLADELTDDSNFVWVLLRNLLVAVGIGGLLVVAAVLSVVSSSGIEVISQWIGISASGDLAGGLSRTIGLLVVFAIDTAAIALMFRLLSGVNAPPRVLWGGAAIGGVGLIVLQELSGLF